MFIFSALLFFQLQVPHITKKLLPARSHYGLRDTTHNYIVIHNDGSNNSAITTYYTLKQRHKGYHFFIDREGRIYQFVDLRYAAKHAGYTKYFGLRKWSEFSIAICLQGSSKIEYSEKQYESLKNLIEYINIKYPDSKTKAIVGHDKIALPRGRKNDPGPLFNYNFFMR